MSGWPLLTTILTLLLLLWRLILDYVPLYPLNDLERKTVRTRRKDWAVHYLPLTAVLLLTFISGNISTALAIIILCLYALFQVATWWLPYLNGGTDIQKNRWDSLYERTHRFLPSIRNHTIPDTAQVITGVVTILALIGLIFTISPGSVADQEEGVLPASSTSSPAPSGEPPASSNLLIETAFTQAGDRPEQLLIQTIASAEDSLDIAINAINHAEIVESIIQARIAGAQVRVITDRNESTRTAQNEVLRTLIAAGIPVKESTRGGLMNLKLAIIDGKTGATGSFNFTMNASSINDEMLVIIRDESTVQSWKQQFEAMWNDSENYRDIQF